MKRVAVGVAATAVFLVLAPTGAALADPNWELLPSVGEPVDGLVDPYEEYVEDQLPFGDGISEVCVDNEDTLAYPICVVWGESSTVDEVLLSADAVVDENTPCSLTEPSESGYEVDAACN